MSNEFTGSDYSVSYLTHTKQSSFKEDCVNFAGILKENNKGHASYGSYLLYDLTSGTSTYKSIILTNATSWVAPVSFGNSLMEAFGK